MNIKQENTKTKLTEIIADCISGAGETTRQSVLAYGVYLYTNPGTIGDVQLRQSVTLINFLNNQIKNGNDDVITPDVITEIFAYILQKLTTGITYKKL